MQSAVKSGSMLTITTIAGRFRLSGYVVDIIAAFTLGSAPVARFLTAEHGDQLRWACVDELSLCTAPGIAERRFAAYLAPFVDEQDARQALVEAGCDPDSITSEIQPKRARRAAR